MIRLINASPKLKLRQHKPDCVGGMKSTSLSVSSNSYADVNTKAFMVATSFGLMVMFEKSEELVGHFQLL